MSLRSHVKPESLLAQAKEHKIHRLTADSRNHNDALSGGAYSKEVSTKAVVIP